MERDEVEALVREFLEEYLPEKKKERMLRHKKSAPVEASAPMDDGDDLDGGLPEECRSGICEHPEHASDDELEGL